MHPFPFVCYLKSDSFFFSPPYFSSDKSTHQNQFPFPTSTPMSSSAAAVLNGLQADHRPDPGTLFSGSCLISRPNLGGFSFVARWNNYLVSCLLACLGCSTAARSEDFLPNWLRPGSARNRLSAGRDQRSGSRVQEKEKDEGAEINPLCSPSLCVKWRRWLVDKQLHDDDDDDAGSSQTGLEKWHHFRILSGGWVLSLVLLVS